MSAQTVARAPADQRLVSQHLLENFHRALVKEAATMTPAERAEFAVFLSRIGAGGPGGMFGAGPGGPPAMLGRP